MLFVADGFTNGEDKREIIAPGRQVFVLHQQEGTTEQMSCDIGKPLTRISID